MATAKVLHPGFGERNVAKSYVGENGKSIKNGGSTLREKLSPPCPGAHGHARAPAVSNSEQTSVALRHLRGLKSSFLKRSLLGGRLLKRENFSIFVFVWLQRHNNAGCAHLMCAESIQRCPPLGSVTDLQTTISKGGAPSKCKIGLRSWVSCCKRTLLGKRSRRFSTTSERKRFIRCTVW